MEFLTGLAFGFLGSLHCIGMCGPLVLAMPAGSGGWSRFFTGRVVYNSGRVITYALMGMVVGFLGEKIIYPAIQQRISILAGGLILAGVIVPRLFRNASLLPGILIQMYARLRESIGKLLRVTTLPSLFGLGLLNGLLPCGFVYLGIAGAIAAGSTLGGVFFMAGFGFGTIPAMLAVSVFPRVMTAPARRVFGRILPALTLLVGVLLIVRGLNLGIPYLSPKFADSPQGTECCH